MGRLVEVARSFFFAIERPTLGLESLGLCRKKKKKCTLLVHKAQSQPPTGEEPRSVSNS
jgi:hypothetical protein